MKCPKCNGAGEVADGGDAITEFKKYSMSQREVARRMGVSAAYLGDLLHGKRGWNANIWKRFLEAVRRPS